MLVSKKIRNLILASSATVASVAAFAEGTVTVETVKGSKAIVKFEGVTPAAGQTYDLGGGGGGGGAGTREHYLALDSNLFNKSLGENADPMSIALAGTIGFNMGQFEIGVPVEFGFTGAQEGGESSMSFGLGIDPQFNFSNNSPGEMMVPFIHGTFMFSMADPSAALAALGVTGKVKTLTFGGGIGLKFFLNDQVAITAGFDFMLGKVMVDNASLGKSISIPIGVRGYF